MKSQTVRLIDVFLLGPGMIYAGTRPSNLPPWLRLFLVGTGIATIAYNGHNYRVLQEALTDDRITD